MWRSMLWSCVRKRRHLVCRYKSLRDTPPASSGLRLWQFCPTDTPTPTEKKQKMWVLQHFLTQHRTVRPFSPGRLISSERPADFYQPTSCYNPQGSHLCSHFLRGSELPWSKALLRNVTNKPRAGNFWEQFLSTSQPTQHRNSEGHNKFGQFLTASDSK